MEEVTLEIKDEIKNEVKGFIMKAETLFHKVGFWFIVVIMLGFFIGGVTMRWYYNINMDKSIRLGGFVYDKDNKIYDIKERVR